MKNSLKRKRKKVILSSKLLTKYYMCPKCGSTKSTDDWGNAPGTREKLDSNVAISLYWRCSSCDSNAQGKSILLVGTVIESFEF